MEGNLLQSLPHPKKTTDMGFNFIIHMCQYFSNYIICTDLSTIHKLLLRQSDF